MLRLAVAFTLGNMALAFINCWILYTELKFEWESTANGIFISCLGVIMALQQGVFLKPAMKHLGQQKMTYIGAVLMMFMLVGFAMAPWGWTLPVILLVFSPGFLVIPSLRGLISKQVEGEKKGQLQGSLGALSTLAHAIAPLAVTSSFGYFVSDEAFIYFPGFPFTLCALFELGVVVVAYQAFKQAPKIPSSNRKSIQIGLTQGSVRHRSSMSIIRDELVEADFDEDEPVFAADIYNVDMNAIELTDFAQPDGGL
jgi:hypothetical protein